MTYQDLRFSEDEAIKIVDVWRKQGVLVDYCENHHGVVYWNKSTGEILWFSGAEDDPESNASLVFNESYPDTIKSKLK